jgi:outer membrane protein insertion porin family
MRNKGEAGNDVSSLYLDFGYLFFHVEPTETKINKDTVNLEMRIVEGAQADYNRITIKGNTRTNDKVILRQLKTPPGEKFSKSQVIRTVRELSTLGYFDEQKINPAVNPNQNDGTVDIEYQLEEKPSDQVELSGGFGGGRIIGSLGLTFNNFSVQKLVKGNWEGLLPQGDGQKVSIKASANGKQYQVYNLSFQEPWFGGHKPITLGINLSTSLLSSSPGVSISSPQYSGANITTLSFSLGKQLRIPDDYFSIQYGISFSQYKLRNYGQFIFRTGTSFSLALSQIISRNSIDQPIYPTSGSNIRFSIEATPPYSAFNKIDYRNTNITPADKFRYTEYHKWKFDASWFIKVYGKLVLNTQARFGFVGFYNNDIGVPQLNRFLLGGDGLQGFNFLQSTEIIGLRGYQNYSVLPQGGDPNSGSPIYDKFAFEIRHPLVTSQSATIYMLGFVEGGNTWNSLATYAPFNMKRSAGLGLRIYLPIFGLLGLDYGYGFDQIVGNSAANKGQFHFTINKGLDGF